MNNLPGVDVEKHGSWEHNLGPVNGNLSHTMLACVFTISFTSRVVFVGAEAGELPLTGSDLPSKLVRKGCRGNRKGEGRERGNGRVGKTTCLTPPHWLLPQIPPCLRQYCLHYYQAYSLCTFLTEVKPGCLIDCILLN